MCNLFVYWQPEKNRLENIEPEKKQKIMKYLFYHLEPKPRVNDLSCNLFLVDFRNVS